MKIHPVEHYALKGLLAFTLAVAALCALLLVAVAIALFVQAPLAGLAVIAMFVVGWPMASWLMEE